MSNNSENHSHSDPKAFLETAEVRRLPLPFRLAAWYSRHGFQTGKWKTWRLVSTLFGTGKLFEVQLDHGARAVVDLSDPISRYPVAYGKMPETELAGAVKSVLSGGDSFWDVGANFGYYTLMAAQIVGTSGSVHAFEPQHHICRLLRESTRRNGYQNVTVHSLALGEEADTGTIHTPVGHQSGISTLDNERHWLSTIASSTSKVQIATVDDLVNDCSIDPPDVMKIDTEGYELPVLIGSDRTMREHCPIIFFEVTPDPNSAAANRRLETLLAERDYKLYRLDGNTLQSPDALNALTEQSNICAWSPQQHGAVEQLIMSDV